MTNIELTKLVEEQQDTIGRLTSRLSTLTDEVVLLQSTMETFKGHIANDMRRVIEKIQSR